MPRRGSRRRSRHDQPTQQTFAFTFAGNRRTTTGRHRRAKSRRGGRRPNIPGRPGVWHLPRPAHNGKQPVHVVWRVRRDAPNLRAHRAVTAIEGAFQRGHRSALGFRLCHYVVMGNHAHLICEAPDRSALSRGLQGLAIRVARAVNRATVRRGKLFADRYFARALTSPREVHRALVYVLHNHRKHLAERGGTMPRDEYDACSSAVWFDGWRDLPARAARARASPPTVAAPTTWLLRTGWRRHGLLSIGGPVGVSR